MTPYAGPAFLVVGHEDIEGGLWVFLRLAPLILLPLAIFQAFRFDHPRWLFFPYDNLITLGQLSLRWQNHDLFPSSSTMFMFIGNGSLLSFIWGLSANFNRPSFIAD
jgi:hypothetical protein